MSSKNALSFLLIILLLVGAGFALYFGYNLSQESQTDTTDAICGNGQLETGEECDDGNVEAGDGCSFNCTLEDVDDEDPGDTPVADDELLCNGEWIDKRVDFEDLPDGSATTDSQVINSQFEDAYKISFSLGPVETVDRVYGQCPESYPHIAKEGRPRTAHSYAGDQPDGIAPSQKDRIGSSFLTDDGQFNRDNSNVPCSLIIDMLLPTYEFSFDIIDIDGNEAWYAIAYDENDNEIKKQLIGPYSSGKLDGKPKRLVFEKVATPIHKIKLIAKEPRSENPWGLAFDNFSPVCAGEAEPDPLEIVKTGSITEPGDDSSTIEYTLTVTNPNNVEIEGVTVEDTMESFVREDDITNLSSYDFSFDAVSSTGTWGVGTMKALDSIDIQYELVVASENYGIIDNIAVVLVNDDPQDDDDEVIEIVVDPIVLPKTAILGDERDYIIFGLVLISTGVSLYFSIRLLTNTERFKKLIDRFYKFEKDMQKV